MNNQDDFFKNKVWWESLHEDLKELFRESLLLIKTVNTWEEKFHDYAFIVFPAAKAYEGFLKSLFLNLGFITQEDYNGKRFRVGKALNPELDLKFRQEESVYDKFVNFCNGKHLADELWNTWKECRNLIFHWFPNERNAIDFNEAKEKVNLVIATMDLVFKECKIELKSQRVEEHKLMN
ncbi:hypothetical protein A2Z22_04425 [Candidatus Woesebacteria bacterium RBG_16_34_12]|uniref:Bacterial toxin RNase RnlA/LsoA DBD domain-containing protein n=1 Tax=Candidatus Woesebacteria bacterium RBG_16_34_12 TaxID=1802480 RepID=A0A1F7X9S2_9BACT|nr:MAG: hypothetical protein A2Z22_04425 [Candidatus Woesebacteria bacterium RBG_16_34_12]